MVRPDSRRVSRVPRYLGTKQKTNSFRLQGCHPLWQAFPDLSTRSLLCNFLHILQFCSLVPQHLYHNGCILSRDTGLGSSAFARRYLRNHFVFFSSGYLDVSVRPLTPLASDQASPWPGCPIRESPDLWMFAPPRSVSPLTAPFIGSLPLGIHHTPFIA